MDIATLDVQPPCLWGLTSLPAGEKAVSRGGFFFCEWGKFANHCLYRWIQPVLRLPTWYTFQVVGYCHALSSYNSCSESRLWAYTNEIFYCWHQSQILQARQNRISFTAQLPSCIELSIPLWKTPNNQSYHISQPSELPVNQRPFNLSDKTSVIRIEEKLTRWKKMILHKNTSRFHEAVGW